MRGKYKLGDHAWIVVSSIMIREVEVLRFAGGLYTVRFMDSAGGIKIRESRLIATKDEAEAQLPSKKKKYRSPWDPL